MLKKYLSVILVLFSTSSCINYSTFDIRKPMLMSTKVPEGPAEYMKGWKDGCDSGITATNSHLLLSVGHSPFAYDQNFEGNQLYFQAWRYGFEHCGYSIRTLARYSF